MSLELSLVTNTWSQQPLANELVAQHLKKALHHKHHDQLKNHATSTPVDPVLAASQNEPTKPICVLKIAAADLNNIAADDTQLICRACLDSENSC